MGTESFVERDGQSKFAKTYSHMTDEELIRVRSARASLVPEAASALDDECARRGINEATVQASLRDTATQAGVVQEAEKRKAATGKRTRVIRIFAWFAGLLVFNIVFLSPRGVHADGVKIFLEALGQLTTPTELIVSAIAILGIRSA